MLTCNRCGSPINEMSGGPYCDNPDCDGHTDYRYELVWKTAILIAVGTMTWMIVMAFFGWGM